MLRNLGVLLVIASMLLSACGSVTSEGALAITPFFVTALSIPGEDIVFLSVAGLAGADGSIQYQNAKQCIGRGGIPTYTPPNPDGGMGGGNGCDISHLLEDGNPNRPQGRIDAMKAARDQGKDPTTCKQRVKDGAIILLFETVSYTSSLHPDRKPYSAVWSVYNPTVTSNNLTVGGYKKGPEEISGYEEFTTSLDVRQSDCGMALKVLRDATNFLAHNQGWGGGDW